MMADSFSNYRKQMNELNTHIFFDVLGFDCFEGVVCRVQRSKHETVRKHTFQYCIQSKFNATFKATFLHFAI